MIARQGVFVIASASAMPSLHFSRVKTFSPCWVHVGFSPKNTVRARNRGASFLVSRFLAASVSLASSTDSVTDPEPVDQQDHDKAAFERWMNKKEYKIIYPGNLSFLAMAAVFNSYLFSVGFFSSSYFFLVSPNCHLANLIFFAFRSHNLEIWWYLHYLWDL